MKIFAYALRPYDELPRLDSLSRDIQQTVGSRFTELHEVYVPLSMALLTSYDETYLGIGPAPREKA